MILIPLMVIGVHLCLFVYVVLSTRKRIVFPENVPGSKFTLVLGAGLEKNGLPTDILSDRVETAVNLLNRKRTKILVLSGSVNTQSFSEPESMSELAYSLGVDKSELILDRKGRTTFNSLVNIADYSGNEIVTIVTQRFHLPRALWLSSSLKINAYGIPANIYKFSAPKIAYWYFREIFALPVNVIKIVVYKLQIKL